jgi:hypothetical protein
MFKLIEHALSSEVKREDLAFRAAILFTNCENKENNDTNPASTKLRSEHQWQSSSG